MMIHGDMTPLSIEEVSSIYKPRRYATNSISSAPTPVSNPLTAPIESAKIVNTGEVNPFKMFSTEETDLSIKLKINLPDKG